jgi:hypothetical protein
MPACIILPSREETLMFPYERRTTRRHKLCLALRFHRQDAFVEDENGAISVNVSTRGVYFVSSIALSVGEKIEISMKMPRLVTGEKPFERLFTGKVTHVDSFTGPQGYLGIGVHLFYYAAKPRIQPSL